MDGVHRWATRVQPEPTLSSSMIMPSAQGNTAGYPPGDSRSPHCFEFQQTGSCRRANCRFLHDSRKSPIPGNDNRECWNWRDGGACQYGDSCRFSHTPRPTSKQRPTSANPPKDGKDSRLCHNWTRRGSCRFGDGCRYEHSGEKTRGHPYNRNARNPRHQRRNQTPVTDPCNYKPNHGGHNKWECRDKTDDPSKSGDDGAAKKP